MTKTKEGRSNKNLEPHRISFNAIASHCIALRGIALHCMQLDGSLATSTKGLGLGLELDDEAWCGGQKAIHLFRSTYRS